MILFVILAIVFAVLLHFTPFGRGIFAIGLSTEAARFSGVQVERTKFILFVLSGAVSALAGIYYTLRFGSARGDNATGLELSVIAAVLLGGVSIFGGRGALHGVIAGVLLIGTLASALASPTSPPTSSTSSRAPCSCLRGGHQLPGLAAPHAADQAEERRMPRPSPRTRAPRTTSMQSHRPPQQEGEQ